VNSKRKWGKTKMKRQLVQQVNSTTSKTNMFDAASFDGMPVNRMLFNLLHL
jgi:hypothetical protein